MNTVGTLRNFQILAIALLVLVVLIGMLVFPGSFILFCLTLPLRDAEALKSSGFIDKNGKFAFHELNSVMWGFHFSEGLRIAHGKVMRKDGTCVPLVIARVNDKEGATSDVRFREHEEFSEGLAAVQDNYWGFINKDGKYEIKPQFDNAHSCSNTAHGNC